jgi:hypothetical protein
MEFCAAVSSLMYCVSLFIPSPVLVASYHGQGKVIQGDSERKVNILGGDSISHCVKNVHMNICLILSGYRDTVV